MTPPRTWVAPALLSFVAGYVDTVGFVALFGLFTAHVTGNFVLIGATLGSVAGGGIGTGLLAKLLALPMFIVGVAITTVVLRKRLGANGTGAQVALAMQGGGILLFMLAGLAAQPLHDADASAAVLCGVLGVLAMSVQNAASRLVFIDMAPSTVMTGNVTQLVIDSLDLLGSTHEATVNTARARFRKMLPPVIAFTVGALSGGLGYHFFGFLCLSMAVLALLGAFIVLRSQGSARPADDGP